VRDALVYDYPETAPLPRRMQPYHFSHTFIFTANPFPANAVGFDTFTFRPGSEFIWTALGVMGSNPTSATADPAALFYLSFYIGFDRRPLQSSPILGSTLRGGGFNAIARTAWGLPLPIKPTYFRPQEPLRVDVNNRRAPAIGQTVQIDVVLHGLRRYPND
jgi:hypothetical protein